MRVILQFSPHSFNTEYMPIFAERIIAIRDRTTNERKLYLHTINNTRTKRMSLAINNVFVLKKDTIYGVY